MQEKRILILFRGMGTRPCIDYLLRDEYNAVNVASPSFSTAARLVRGRPRVMAIPLNMRDPDLDRQTAARNLVISMVPFIHHVDIARSSIKGKTNIVIRGHISPAVKSLDAVVKRAGIAELYEIGVDSGTNQLYATRHIASIHATGAKVCQLVVMFPFLPAQLTTELGESHCIILKAQQNPCTPLSFK
ncbi:unnamed protein product, partial [Clonostachys byssicola]